MGGENDAAWWAAGACAASHPTWSAIGSIKPGWLKKMRVFRCRAPRADVSFALKTSSRYCRQPEYELNSRTSRTRAPARRRPPPISQRSRRRGTDPSCGCRSRSAARSRGRRVPAERCNQRAVLGVDRADAAEMQVVVRHLVQPLARTLRPRVTFSRNGSTSSSPLRSAERDHHDRIEPGVRKCRDKPVGRCAQNRLAHRCERSRSSPGWNGGVRWAAPSWAWVDSGGHWVSTVHDRRSDSAP